MSNSIIKICNEALSNIGQASISDLSENSPEAIECNKRYENARDEVLSKFPWSFATGPVTLALTTVKYPGWKYVYQYPANAVALRRVFDPTDALNPVNPLYKTFSDGTSKYIVCNVENAWADITFKVSDPNLFDIQFSTALSYRLAIEIVVPLTGKDDRKAGLYQEYMNILASAQLNSANENNFKLTLPTSYINVRR